MPYGKRIVGIQSMVEKYGGEMRGNERDCICHKPNGKHTEYCDAYRLSEFLKKCASTVINDEPQGVFSREHHIDQVYKDLWKKIHGGG